MSADKLYLSPYGEALAHFVLPLRGIAKNIASIESALEKTRESWVAEEKRNPIVDYEFIWVAGECDLLLRIELDDFRLIAKLQSRLLAETVRSVSWVFCVPYETDLQPMPLAKARQNALDNGVCPVSFVLHLRVRRSIYQTFGLQGEHAIVRALQGILAKRQSSIQGTVAYTLGWADLTIRGQLTGSLDDFHIFILEVHSLHIPQPASEAAAPPPEVTEATESTDQHIFSKSLTVLGLSWNAIRTTEPDHTESAAARGTEVIPAMLARVHPGKFAPALEKLSKLHTEHHAEKTDVDVHILDGKWDVRLTPQKGSGAVDVATFYRTFRDLKLELEHSGIERTQTHLSFFDSDQAQTLLERADRVAVELPKDSASGPWSTCGCATAEFAALRRLESNPEYLPRSIQATASNVLVMFSYALRDHTSCCDAFPALDACARGLEDLLESTRLAYEQIPPQEGPRQEQSFARVRNLWVTVERWCVQAEQVLRERISGSFDDLFSPSDSIAAYRGSLQNILFISDHLTQQFYDQIADLLKDARGEASHRFATIYKPQVAMSSEPLVGIINIPSRHAFSLHLILPQLWHEVGQYCFHQYFMLPHSTRTERRLRALGDRLQTAKGEGHVGRFIWEAQSISTLVQDTSDMFADLIVLHYGFSNNFALFSHHLVTLHLDTIANHRLPDFIQERIFATLFIRLFFTLNFIDLCTVADRELSDSEKLPETFRPALEGRIETMIGTAESEYEEASRSFDQVWNTVLSFLVKPKYNGLFRLLPGMEDKARLNVISETYRHFWSQYLLDLVEIVSTAQNPARFPHEPPESRVIPDPLSRDIPASEMSEYYLALYCQSLSRLTDCPRGEPLRPHFDTMGSLGRSAILAFHKDEGHGAGPRESHEAPQEPECETPK